MTMADEIAAREAFSARKVAIDRARDAWGHALAALDDARNYGDEDDVDRWELEAQRRHEHLLSLIAKKS